MEQRALKIVNNCLNTNIYSYLETSGGQSYNLYLNVVLFSAPVLLRHLWQLNTVVFLHWCRICAFPFISYEENKVLNMVPDSVRQFHSLSMGETLIYSDCQVEPKSVSFSQPYCQLFFSSEWGQIYV
jgi:hypothetical protein